MAHRRAAPGPPLRLDQWARVQAARLAAVAHRSSPGEGRLRDARVGHRAHVDAPHHRTTLDGWRHRHVRVASGRGQLHAQADGRQMKWSWKQLAYAIVASLAIILFITNVPEIMDALSTLRRPAEVGSNALFCAIILCMFMACVVRLVRRVFGSK